MTRPGADFGLEVWLSGAPDELDRAVDVLCALGRLVHRNRVPLTGSDRGRYRLYLQLRLPARPHTAADDAPLLRTLPADA